MAATVLAAIATAQQVLLGKHYVALGGFVVVARQQLI